MPVPSELMHQSDELHIVALLSTERGRRSAMFSSVQCFLSGLGSMGIILLFAGIPQLIYAPEVTVTNVVMFLTGALLLSVMVAGNACIGYRYREEIEEIRGVLRDAQTHDISAEDDKPPNYEDLSFPDALPPDYYSIGECSNLVEVVPIHTPWKSTTDEDISQRIAYTDTDQRTTMASSPTKTPPSPSQVVMVVTPSSKLEESPSSVFNFSNEVSTLRSVDGIATSTTNNSNNNFNTNNNYCPPTSSDLLFSRNKQTCKNSESRNLPVYSRSNRSRSVNAISSVFHPTNEKFISVPQVRDDNRSPVVPRRTSLSEEAMRLV